MKNRKIYNSYYMSDLWKIKIWLFIQESKHSKSYAGTIVIITTAQTPGLSSHLIVEDEQMVL